MDIYIYIYIYIIYVCFLLLPKVAQVASVVKKLEDGDLKLRVRTLEVERMLERVEIRQRVMGAGLLSALLLQISLGTNTMTITSNTAYKFNVKLS